MTHTTRRPLLFVALVALVSVVSGCGNGDAEPDELDESVNELTGGGLKNVTVVPGSVTEGSSVTVAYEPTAYENASSNVPYLAIELLPSPAKATSDDGAREAGGVRPMNGPTTAGGLSVNVAGDFPGAPHVLVADEKFRVLASTRAVSTELGEKADLQVPATPGKKFILVRDMLWVKPMAFNVTVGR